MPQIAAMFRRVSGRVRERFRPYQEVLLLVLLLWKYIRKSLGMIGDYLTTVQIWPVIIRVTHWLWTFLGIPQVGDAISGIGILVILIVLLRPDPPDVKQLKAFLSDRKRETGDYVAANAADILHPKKILSVRAKEVIAATPTTFLPEGATQIHWSVLADVETKEPRRAAKTETLDITLAGTVQKREGQYVNLVLQNVQRIR